MQFDEAHLVYFFVVVLNIVLSVVIFEVWLRLENKIKSKPLSAVTGVFSLLIYGGLGVLLYQSVRFVTPTITLSELKYATVVWAVVMLVYLVNYFSPRRKFNTKFKDGPFG